ncbi:hypothetical protein ABVK25_006262 [Lepraria finkii]|uniref:Transposase n=1 Tax=Lepraria finkii TaxID=1340010 RepID=A0ABR4B6W6_9LECA
MGRVTRKKTRKKTRNKKYDTPRKAKVQGAYEYLVAKGIPFKDTELFDYFDVEKRAGYRFIAEGEPSRTIRNQEGYNKTRGRPNKLTGADVRETDHLLEENHLDMEAKGMPWDAISWTMDFEVSGHTLQRTMRDALTYSKHLSALKEHLPEPLRQKRKKWAGDMYAKYPKPEDWERVRFSDEVHAGYGPEGHLWIARKRGKAMRYRWDNIQHRGPPSGKERPRVHT